MSDVLFSRTAGTWMPTPSIRWLIDYDGERVLQQAWKCLEDGGVRWVRVPEVDYSNATQEGKA